MKKIIIGATALTLSVALVGCGNSANNAAVTNLSSQLDDTANTISSIQTVNPTELNLTKESLDAIATRDNSGAIYDNVIGSQQTILGEEYYKMDILNKTAALKNNLSKDLKLSKAQITAVRELTKNLDKYTNSVAYTKNELSSTIKSISSLKKNAEKNTDRINAKLNRLACNSNTRSAYYQNILNTLTQLEKYVGCEDCEENTNSTNESEINNQNCPNCNYGNITNSPYVAYNSNNINRMNGAYGYGAGYYGAPYGQYAAPYGGYGMGNPYYGYNSNNINNARFNPSRNTDTYAPLQRNIDTYNLPTNEGVLNNTLAPVTTQPEQRLESFEEVKDDNTVEQVKNDDSTQNSEIKETTSQLEENNFETKENNCKNCEELSIQTFAEKKRIDELNQPTIAHNIKTF